MPLNADRPKRPVPSRKSRSSQASQHLASLVTPVSVSPAPAPGGADVKPLNTSSCAECRRLKLKCNREWPCSNCTKRGCAQICPTGKMKTGKGKRMILADTEELHERISLLEGALHRAHAQLGDGPHPLLTEVFQYEALDADDILAVRLAAKDRGRSEPADGTEDPDERGEGMLWLGPSGDSRFIGPTAGSEHFQPVRTGGPLTLTPPATATSPPVSSRLDQVLQIDSSHGRLEQVEGAIWRLKSCLPEWQSEGKMMAEQYWENVNWMHQIIPRPIFDAQYLPYIVEQDRLPAADKLACVFLVFALGTLFDLYRPALDPRADELFACARAALSLVEPNCPSLSYIQALHLYGTYVLNSRQPHAAEVVWASLGTAIKAAQALGLHRDGQRFGLSAQEAADRRQAWWELVGADRMQALCLGRPSAPRNGSSDAPLPSPTEWFADSDGFHRARAGLYELLEQVNDLQVRVKAVSYTEVVAMDRNLCRFKAELPGSLLPDVKVDQLPMTPDIHPHIVEHRLTIRCLIASVRLLLNRPYFARALRDCPADPSTAATAHSFIAAFESAQTAIACVRQLVIFHPSLVSRWWFFWFHAYSSAVCLAAVVIKAPTCPFAPPAFQSMCAVLEIAYATEKGCKARQGLPVLFRLRRKAADARNKAGRPQAILPIPLGKPGDEALRQQEVGEVDDLQHLDGRGAALSARTSAIRTANSATVLHEPSQPSAIGPGQTHAPVAAVTPWSTTAQTFVSPTEPPDLPFTAHIHDSSSPLSGSSFSNTSTLVEPMFYDPVPPHGLTPSLNAWGAVPPPPPSLIEHMPRTPNDETVFGPEAAQPSDSSAPHSLAWSALDGATTPTWHQSPIEIGPSRELWSITSTLMDEDLCRAFGLQSDLQFAPARSSSPLPLAPETQTPEQDFDWEMFMNIVGDMDT